MSHTTQDVEELIAAAKRLLLYMDDPSRHDCGTDGVEACAWCSLRVTLKKFGVSIK